MASILKKCTACGRICNQQKDRCPDCDGRLWFVSIGTKPPQTSADLSEILSDLQDVARESCRRRNTRPRMPIF